MEPSAVAGPSAATAGQAARHAASRSPFYQRFHQGLQERPLAELPVLTQATLLDHLDEITTDPALRLADLEAYLAGLVGDKRFAGRYWVSSTSGSSGRKSIIPSDAHEWAMILASYARANQWAGINAGLLHRVRMAVVSSTAPWHQSARVAATLRSPLVDSHRLDAAAPPAQIVARLNDLQPQVLVAYASMLRMLAEEQLAGRLQIAPQAVNSASEPLTAEGRALAQRAWHVPPFDVYAATETGGIAAECEQHTGMHLFEDLVLTEVVDADSRPVPPGVSGDRLLVTVLFSRTLPLIRYELTDRVRLATKACPCGRPFRLLAVVEGRTDQLLRLPGRDGTHRPVHPVVFHRALVLADAAGWQVRQDPDGWRQERRSRRRPDRLHGASSPRTAGSNASLIPPESAVRLGPTRLGASSKARPRLGMPKAVRPSLVACLGRGCPVDSALAALVPAQVAAVLG